MNSFVSRLCVWIGRVSGYSLFLIAIFVSYEVVARYIFNSPTMWAEELSRLLLTWSIFMGTAYVLQAGQMIEIDIVVKSLKPKHRRFIEVVKLFLISCTSLIIAYYSLLIVFDSLQYGRRATSMLALPEVFTQLSLPIGFTLLAVQAFALILTNLTCHDSVKKTSADSEACSH